MSTEATLPEPIIFTDSAAAKVADLIAHLAARGGVWQEELAKGAALRIALNQEMVTENTALTDGAEVAVFRPVTGG